MLPLKTISMTFQGYYNLCLKLGISIEGLKKAKETFLKESVELPSYGYDDKELFEDVLFECDLDCNVEYQYCWVNEEFAIWNDCSMVCEAIEEVMEKVIEVLGKEEKGIQYNGVPNDVKEMNVH